MNMMGTDNPCMSMAMALFSLGIIWLASEMVLGRLRR